MSAWQLVAIQLVTFVGLILALRMLFSRQLNAALQRLQALQEEALVKEAQLKEELRRAQEERVAEVDKGWAEAKVLVDAAKHDAEVLCANAELQARQESEKILARGREEVEKLRANARAEIEAEAMRLSMEMIKRAFTEPDQEGFQRHRLGGLIQEIGGLSKDRFAAHAKTASVSSSVPLTADERHRLRRALSEKLDAEITLSEGIDPELITGLVVQVGSLVIDGSLKNQLRRVLAALRNDT